MRVIVFLHLYYPESWAAVWPYLRTLGAFDLRVSVTEGRIPEGVLEEIRRACPGCGIAEVPNVGYDIAPFLHLLKSVDLSAYDVVYKLHGKGGGVPTRYIYGQVFRGMDWFHNLYRGVLGSGRTDEVLRILSSDPSVGLVAAGNLIVGDPPHKRALTRRIAERLGIPLPDGYRFVAGTCFAARAEALRPLQALGLDLADFPATARGTFSLAHALERLLCVLVERAGFALRGLPVRRRTYPLRRLLFRALSPLRLLDDPRFEIDPDFFYRVLEGRKLLWHRVRRVRLGDLATRDEAGRVRPLAESPAYRYAGDPAGERERYAAYCAENRSATGFEMSPERFDGLLAGIGRDGYDERRMPVVVGRNYIMDGQHRCAVLLRRKGPDHRIPVLKLRLVPFRLLSRLRHVFP